MKNKNTVLAQNLAIIKRTKARLARNKNTSAAVLNAFNAAVAALEEKQERDREHCCTCGHYSGYCRLAKGLLDSRPMDHCSYWTERDEEV